MLHFGAHDYRHIHALVRCTALEALVMPGQAAFDVVAKRDENGEACASIWRKQLTRLAIRPRSLTLLDTAVELMAVLAIDIAQVASVVITAQPAQALGNRDKIFYYCSDGPEVLLMSEEKSWVVLSAAH